MTKSTHRSGGCAVCTPALQRPLDETVAERRKEIAEMLHVVRMSDGYHVLQIPGDDGASCSSWPGPFESESAAKLFRDDLIQAAAQGNPGDACCSYGVFDHYNLAGRFLDIIVAHSGDDRSLARAIASQEPWKPAPATVADDAEIAY